MADIDDKTMNVSVHKDGADSSNSLEIDSLGRARINMIDSTGKEAEFDDANRLKVNATGDVVVTNANQLIYDKLTGDQALTNGSYINIYNDTAGTNGSKVFSIMLRFSHNDIDFKIIVDSITIIDFNTEDLYTNYRLDLTGIGNDNYGQLPRKLYTYDTGRNVIIELPMSSDYVTNLVIQAQANADGRSLIRGFVVKADG